MEYAKGGTLSDLLKEKKKINEKDMKNYFSQIFDGIFYCHQKHIIHRDLKPENIIFFDKEKTVIKIIDFGVAGWFQNELNKAGSISYLAPEVISGISYESSPKLDIYSCGCILYELATGEKLFNGKNYEEKKDKILRGKFILSKNITAELAHLINNMIIINPDDRYSLDQCRFHPWMLNKSLNEELLNDFAESQKIVVKRHLNSCLNLTEKISKDFLNVSTTTDIKLNKLDNDVNNIEKVKSIPLGKVNSELVTITEGNTVRNNINTKKKLSKNVIKSNFSSNNLEEKSKVFDFNKYVSGTRGSSLSSTRINFKSINTGMITKISDVENVDIYRINYEIFRNNGKHLSYLQPIGFTKSQKKQSERIKKIMLSSSKISQIDLEDKTKDSNNIENIGEIGKTISEFKTNNYKLSFKDIKLVTLDKNKVKSKIAKINMNKSKTNKGVIDGKDKIIEISMSPVKSKDRKNTLSTSKITKKSTKFTSSMLNSNPISNRENHVNSYKTQSDISMKLSNILPKIP